MSLPPYLRCVQLCCMTHDDASMPPFLMQLPFLHRRILKSPVGQSHWLVGSLHGGDDVFFCLWGLLVWVLVCPFCLVPFSPGRGRGTGCLLGSVGEQAPKDNPVPQIFAPHASLHLLYHTTTHIGSWGRSLPRFSPPVLVAYATV